MLTWPVAGSLVLTIGLAWRVPVGPVDVRLPVWIAMRLASLIVRRVATWLAWRWLAGRWLADRVVLRLAGMPLLVGRLTLLA